MSVESVEQSPYEPRPWVLVALAGLGTLFAILSWFGTWMTMQLTVSGLRDSYLEFGFSYFGNSGMAYVAGNLLLAVLLGLALWGGGRWRTWLSVAALGVTALMLANLVLVLSRLGAIEADAATELVLLRDSADGLPSYVEMRVRTPALIIAELSTMLFALVAVQLPWPRQGPWIQAFVGLALCAVATVMPWTRLWTVDAWRSAVPVRSYFWLWSNPYECVGALLLVSVLVWVVFSGMRAPGYARHRRAIGATLLALLALLGAQLLDMENRMRAYDMATMLDVTSTGAANLMGTGALLLATGMLRSWWHGREEIVPATPGDSWLPARIRERRG